MRFNDDHSTFLPSDSVSRLAWAHITMRDYPNFTCLTLTLWAQSPGSGSAMAGSGGGGILSGGEGGSAEAHPGAATVDLDLYYTPERDSDCKLLDTNTDGIAEADLKKLMNILEEES